MSDSSNTTKLWYGTASWNKTFETNLTQTGWFGDSPGFDYLLFSDGGDHGASTDSRFASGTGTWNGDVWMAVGNSTQGDKIDRYVALMKFNYTLDASAGVQGDKVTVDPAHQAGGTNNATSIANWSDTLGTLPALAPIFNPEWNKAFPTGNWPGP
jgi:hypothetical protein